MNKILLLLFITFLLFRFELSAQVEYESFLEGATVNDITTDGSSLWFSTYGQGISQYIPKEKKWITYSTKNNSLTEDLFYCIAASKDFVWVGTTDGLMTFDRKRNLWRKRKFGAGGEYGNWIRSLYYDQKENILWIGRFINLTRFDIDKQKYDDFDITYGKDPKTNNVKIIRADGNEYLWFGTEGGVFRYDKSRVLEDKSQLIFYNNQRNAFRGVGDAISISDILFDKNYIWFGTDEFITRDNPEFNVGGLFRFNRRALWERIEKRNGLPANGIFALERTGSLIWVSCYQFDKKNKKEYGRGLALFNTSTGKISRVNPDDINLTSNTILSLYFDGESMWIGTETGLTKVKVSNPLAYWSGQKKVKTK